MTDRPGKLRIAVGLLAGGMALGAACLSYGHSLAPYLEREREARTARARIDRRIEEARARIREIRTLESSAHEARRVIDRYCHALPQGASMTWMPELLKRHFAAFSLDTAIVRMNTVVPEPDLPGFRRGYWSVGVPLPETGGSATGSLLATAELEQQHPFVKVVDFAIRPDPENPQGRIALLNVAALVRE